MLIIARVAFAEILIDLVGEALGAHFGGESVAGAGEDVGCWGGVFSCLLESEQLDVN